MARITLERPEDGETKEVNPRLTGSVENIGLGGPSSQELLRIRLILSLSEFFDVSLHEARRWVEETEQELRKRDELNKPFETGSDPSTWTPEEEYEDT